MGRRAYSDHTPHIQKRLFCVYKTLMSLGVVGYVHLRILTPQCLTVVIDTVEYGGHTVEYGGQTEGWVEEKEGFGLKMGSTHNCKRRGVSTW